mmetsp:Transcript_45894/g.94806  ORF Transcript_45894/g.94806 Transcript_45894/m.94806 type:complete len:315 (+) Transcript_45894:44-988(+)|eukprot:s506_g7.t1
MRMARFASVLSLVALSTCAEHAQEPQVCDSAGQVNMLQMRTALEDQSRVGRARCGHLLVETCDPAANYPCSNNCRIHTNRRDCYRPLRAVMKEHPGEDGYCIFNQTAFWVNYTGPQLRFEADAKEAILAMRGASYRGLNTGLPILYRFEGQEVSSHMDADHYLFDDLYGFSLGFLQNQGLDPNWMQNTSLWSSLSEQACQRIQQTYHFKSEELILADWLDFNQVIAVMTACSAGMPAAGSSEPSVLKAAGWHSPSDCRPVTSRDFAKHHYVKCLLGIKNSAMDMAVLNARACVLQGNRIGHLTECAYMPAGIDS